MQAENEQERNGIMNGVWLVRAEREELLKWVLFLWSGERVLNSQVDNHSR